MPLESQQTKDPIGTPAELPVAPDAATVAPHQPADELENLRDLCRVVVDAWHGQSSISIDLAMSRLETVIRRERR